MSGNNTNDSDFERQLRQSLRLDAERVSPSDKRTEILAMAHDETEVAHPVRRRFIPLAAAASVALITAITWGVSNSGGTSQVTPRPIPPAGSTSSSASPTTSSSVPGATVQVALPIYFVGATSITGDKFGLYREFVKASIPANATPAQKAWSALNVDMNADPQPLRIDAPYIQPWLGTSVEGVSMTPDLITITLNGSGASGFTSEQTRLAVQELVWTAQAAVGQGTIPVKFVVADGSSTLFGKYPTSSTYNRPAKDLQYEDLAPIWITAPESGHVYKAGTPVEVTGESCAFEATTQWELRGTAAKSGTTMASSGCPTRGTWKVDLGVLAAGGYSFRMFEVSMKDGKVIAETSKPFAVK